MTHQQEFAVRKMCAVLGVSSSGYYHWKKELRKQEKNKEIDEQIVKIFNKSRATYGSPRIYKTLQRAGVQTSESTVARRMRSLDISPERKKRFVATTDSEHEQPIAENILNRQFSVREIGRVWVGDITYIRLRDYFVYLTTVIDLADRMVVGWHLSDNMTDSDTTIAAFKKALANRKITEGLIFHSDRGVQYASKDFRALLKQKNCIQSMSRKGNCWDNAVAESFFKTIKRESLNRYQFKTKDQVYSVVFDYIDGWYNTQRIHTTLGDLSPKMKFLSLQNQKMAA